MENLKNSRGVININIYTSGHALCIKGIKIKHSKSNIVLTQHGAPYLFFKNKNNYYVYNSNGVIFNMNQNKFNKHFKVK